ncbi:hypothetical protein ACFV1C_38680 [Streptomyces sp. NPDC059605]|uniref:hypothetical protein n=1 Tax=unclassified Streptomyces TaxID=2593676 RepID=UPI0036A53B8B
MPIDLRAVPSAPEDPAFTVDQLTPEDFAAITAFLDARLEELVADGHAAAATALAMALDPQLDTLRGSFEWEADHPSEPVPDNWLSERQFAWQQLVIVLWSGWCDAKGYDTVRWTVPSLRKKQPAPGRARVSRAVE